LTAIAPENAAAQQKIIFDPIPRVQGIEVSADPLFEPRANIYLMSGRRAEPTESGKAAIGNRPFFLHLNRTAASSNSRQDSIPPINSLPVCLVA